MFGRRTAHFKVQNKETTAAVVVGISLLVGSSGDVQSACDPPVFDVCFHKIDGGGWTAGDGYAAMDIQFKGESGEKYEVVWHGLKRLYIWDGKRFRYVITRDDVSDYPYWVCSEVTLTYENFWWDHTIPWDWWYGYGCSIYEGSTVKGEWVRESQVATVHFYSYQEAAYVSIDFFFRS